jgi:uncharacterized beta-barrel protein YwiB (DUF1934 family)
MKFSNGNEKLGDNCIVVSRPVGDTCPSSRNNQKGTAMKLEVGKRYVLRNGDVTGYLHECRDTLQWMTDQYKSWLTNGGHYNLGKEASAFDIVAEYVEQQPQQQILPTVKKVVERLWLVRSGSCGHGCSAYYEHWLGYDDQPAESGDWIRTDRTREREI